MRACRSSYLGAFLILAGAVANTLAQGPLIRTVPGSPPPASQGPAGARGGRGAAPPPLVRENVTQKVSDHVYVIPDNNVGMVPNIGIIVGRRATLVVDTGLGARNGQTVVREMERVSKTPELYLVTTHVHPEHDLGAGGFPAHTKMIRSQDQLTEIKESGLETATRFSGFSPLNAELLQGAGFRQADITFDKEHTLDLGGVRVRILAMGYNHTRGDTAMFVEPDGILFSGDVTMTTLPAVGASSSIRQWVVSQERFEKLQPKLVVPSHGPTGDAAMIASSRLFLETIQRRVPALKKQGKSVDETVSAMQTELREKFGESNRIAGTIRTAYIQAP
jgi:glyoxylase-like metal-dependent hydrolase (beta-lactamase superfamily II)